MEAAKILLALISAQGEEMFGDIWRWRRTVVLQPTEDGNRGILRRGDKACLVSTTTTIHIQQKSGILEKSSIMENPFILDKFKNKYRIASARAAWWNYGWAGSYFITICTADRLHYFGEIINKKMQLSNAGILADVFWHEIPHHAKNVELGTFVVMPNHIHGILILNAMDNNNNDKPTVVGVGVETRHALSLPLPLPLPLPLQRFQNQGKNTVSSIMGSYKSAVTKHANRLGMVFGWQSRFHDHIIRNDAEFQRINDYIETNPENWETDKFRS